MTPHLRRLALILAASAVLALAGCSSDDANLYNVLGLDEEDKGPPPETLDEEGRPLAEAAGQDESMPSGEGETAPGPAASESGTAEAGATIDLETAEVFFNADAVPGEPEAA